MLGYSIYRHWHSASEKYTGCDSLLTALRAGWIVHNIVTHKHLMRGCRTTTVHCFFLKRADETAQMHVISNPYVDQLVPHFSFSIPIRTFLIVNGETKDYAQETVFENQAVM